MQVEALKIYCDVVRFHSFSRGAEENDVLQSSASQAVQTIEENLGVALIDRSRRPWAVTEEGRVFYEGCREVVDRYSELVARVKNRKAAVDSVIRVAAIYSVNFADMGRCVERFTQLHPKAKVEVEYAHPDRVCERVLSDEVNLGILSYPDERKGVSVIPWREEPMVLACRRDHRFAKLKKLDVKQLADETLVGFDTELVIWKKIDRFLKDHGVEANVMVRFDNIEAIKRAVEAGSGVALLPRPTLENELELGTLAAVPLVNSDFSRPIGIIHRKGRKLYANTEAFIEVLKNGASTPPRNGHGLHVNGKLRDVKPRPGAKTRS
ncbi:MAG TPA: LysR family transcriptional regulator [Candidatus Limnocylindria bacterium]|nr:LysR family transcriptional regulator [Candidatus Limnocylindria bacterium]